MTIILSNLDDAVTAVERLRVDQVEASTAAMSPAVPLVLLPVRLETRFAAIEVPIEGRQPTLLDLSALLKTAGREIDRIGAADLATTLRGLTGKKKAEFRKNIEGGKYADLEGWIASAQARLDEAHLLQRDPLAPADGGEQALVEAASEIRASLVGATASIAALRSEFQRARFASSLSDLAATAELVLAATEERTIPATKLQETLNAPTADEVLARREALRRRRSARDAVGGEQPSAETEVTPAVVRATAAEARRVSDRQAVLSHEQLAASAEAFTQLRDQLAEAADGSPSAETLSSLAATASTIPLLPGTWKTELIEAAQRRPANASREAWEELKIAVGRIRSDDARLDGDVLGPKITVVVPPATRRQDVLHVRIYPDDLAIDVHEPALTEAERDAAIAYWEVAVAAGSNEETLRGAWRALCIGRSSRRAAYLAHRMQPQPVTSTPGMATAEAVLALLTDFERGLRLSESRKPGRLNALAKLAEQLRKGMGTRKRVPAADRAEIRRRWKVDRSAVDRVIARRPAATLEPDAEAALVRIEAAVKAIQLRIDAIGVEAPPAPIFPDPGPPKKGAWTRAATAGTLPDRFLVVAVRGESIVHAAAGQPVDESLKLSLEPSFSGATQFKLDDDGELHVDDAIRWMIDLDEARSKGMAVTLQISPRDAALGFSRVYVLGVRDEDAARSGKRLQDLLDNHHYGPKGLGLIAPGTPTNNTEAGASGFRSEDDPDAAYDVERRDPLFPITVAADGTVDHGVDPASRDGRRLAGALGLDPRTLAHVEGADGRGVAQTLAMGRALYSAAIGGWLEEQAAPVVPRHVRDRLRSFALDHVAGGALVPAFRVGSQPYGVLPVTAWSLFEPDADDELGPGAAPAKRIAQQRFEDLFRDVLDVLLEDWRAMRDQGVRIATDAPTADARAHFLKVLGLQPASVEAGYRFAVNVAGRHGPPSLPANLRFGLPPVSDMQETGARYGPFAFLTRFDGVLRRAFGITSTAPLRDPTTGFVTDDLAGLYDAVLTSRAYEVRLLEKLHTPNGPLVGANPKADLEALLAAGPTVLLEAAWKKERVVSLLALLLRQAHLFEHRRAALDALSDHGQLDEVRRVAIGASGNFITGGPTQLTPWLFLLERPAALSSYLDTGPFSNATTPLLERVKTATTDPLEPYAGRVAAHAADISSLSTVPAERLEMLLGEALDVSSHRLDAWISGFAHRRLRSLRASQPTGAQIGAYGWVDNLKPELDVTARTLATNVPASLDPDPSAPIFVDGKSQGFIHAPSINHAVTAAILRSGYLSQHDVPAGENRMAVNLSSRRTRLALDLIEGVRSGNRLGALLGYRLERFLHEYYASAGAGAPTLDELIGPLRREYPSKAGVDSTVSPDAAARQVCDGLAIADDVQGWIATLATQGVDVGNRTVAEVLRMSEVSGKRPWGLKVGAVPAASSPLLPGFIQAIDHVVDALDSLADLVVAEGVHQLARGNHARAAAVLTALSEGKAPPRPEVVDTPRTSTPLVHRVLLELPRPATLPAEWAAIPATPRSACEPALNAWLGTVLGDPAKLKLRLVDAETGDGAADVSVADLGLHPIDLLEILGHGLETGFGEIAARALDARRPLDFGDLAVPPGQQVQARRPAEWADDVTGVAELGPLIEALGDLVGRARPALARDYVLASPGAASGGNGSDLGELASRLEAARSAAADAAVGLARLIAADVALDEAVLDLSPEAFLEPLNASVLPAWADRELWRTALLRAAAFGISAALPPSAFSGRVAVRQALREAAVTGYVELLARLEAADDVLTDEDDADPTTEQLLGAARALFGESFTVLPRITPTNAAELTSSFAADLAGPAEIDGWLQGAGMVRDAAGALADVLALADVHGGAVPSAAVAQLPHDPTGAEVWLGGRVATGRDLAGRLSLVRFSASTPAATDTGRAVLLIDEWTEQLPSDVETSGVAVHYDQPDASPPQCVLLAVPPERDVAWTLQSLLQTLHDTFDLAQIRAVEPEHLATTFYGQLLPAISGEVLPSDGPAQSFDRAILDFSAVRP